MLAAMQTETQGSGIHADADAEEDEGTNEEGAVDGADGKNEIASFSDDENVHRYRQVMAGKLKLPVNEWLLYGCMYVLLCEVRTALVSGATTSATACA